MPQVSMHFPGTPRYSVLYHIFWEAWRLWGGVVNRMKPEETTVTLLDQRQNWWRPQPPRVEAIPPTLSTLCLLAMTTNLSGLSHQDATDLKKTQKSQPPTLFPSYWWKTHLKNIREEYRTTLEENSGWSECKLIFQKVQKCLSKKLWDGGRESRKGRRRAGRGSRMLSRSRSWKRESAGPSTVSSWTPAAHPPLAWAAETSLGLWELANRGKVGPGKWQMTRPQVRRGPDSCHVWCGLQCVPLTSCRSQTTVGRRAREWRAYKINSTSPEGGSTSADWHFTAGKRKSTSSAEASNSVSITSRTCYATSEQTLSGRKEGTA